MIRSVAVLGAGVMGAQIAAHVANAGVPAFLLDVTAEAAAEGLKRARALKPDPFFTPDTWKLITTASFEQGFARLGEADWIIEAIVEQRDVKRGLLTRVDQARRAGSIVSSNTSGIPIHALAEGRSDDFRRHWLGTHFFNPPRYLHLLEIIPTEDTSRAVVDEIGAFADHHLGKGVVIAKDTPNFIGNHLALAGVVRLLSLVEAGSYSIEEIDAMTGPAIGRPKSATFRTLDLAGVDVLVHVIRNLHERLPDEKARARFVLPVLCRADGGQGPSRGKGRPGILQARQRRGWGIRDPDTRSRDARVPSSKAREAPLARCGECDLRYCRTDHNALQRQESSRRVPPIDAGACTGVRGERHSRDRVLTR
jgi:3-hydroxyacyl-CoA dehydrogenase